VWSTSVQACGNARELRTSGHCRFVAPVLRPDQCGSMSLMSVSCGFLQVQLEKLSAEFMAVTAEVGLSVQRCSGCECGCHS
jgi:hypothetical protein